MPLITIEVGSLPEGVKRNLITKLTDVAVEVTNFPRESFFVSIRELPDENIAIGGITVKELKEKAGRK